MPGHGDQAAEVLDFWFEQSRPRQWFAKDSAFDPLLQQRFLGLALVPRGDFLNWQLPNPNALPLRIAWRQDFRQPLTAEFFAGVPVHDLRPNNTPAYDPTHWTYRIAQLAAEGLRFQAYGAVPCAASANGFQAKAIGPPVLLEGQNSMPCVW